MSRTQPQRRCAIPQLRSPAANHIWQVLPGDPTAPLGIESPTLIAWASIQAGVTPDGELALRVRPDPLPPMEFRMSDEGARNLIEGLSRGLTMPRPPKDPNTRH